jgi:hypothetical protein
MIDRSRSIQRIVERERHAVHGDKLERLVLTAAAMVPAMGNGLQLNYTTGGWLAPDNVTVMNFDVSKA